MPDRLTRTQEEIVERLRSEEKRDPFGWAVEDLLIWLDFDHAKEFLKPEATQEQWDPMEKPKPVREQMVEYMDFAWEKAKGCRGLSASRSMNHYANWLWLLGEDELAASMLDYEYYGKDNLVKVCECLGLDPKRWDDGVRVNSEEGDDA
jgi:hypothetical protein